MAITQFTIATDPASSKFTSISEPTVASFVDAFPYDDASLTYDDIGLLGPDSTYDGNFTIAQFT